MTASLDALSSMLRVKKDYSPNGSGKIEVGGAIGKNVKPVPVLEMESSHEQNHLYHELHRRDVDIVLFDVSSMMMFREEVLSDLVKLASRQGERQLIVLTKKTVDKEKTSDMLQGVFPCCPEILQKPLVSELFGG